MKVLSTFETSATAHLTTRQTAEDLNLLVVISSGEVEDIVTWSYILLGTSLTVSFPMLSHSSLFIEVLLHATCIAHRALSSVIFVKLNCRVMALNEFLRGCRHRSMFKNVY